MKNFIVGAIVRKVAVFMILALTLVVLPAIGETMQHKYTQQCDVYEVDEDTNLTTFIDPCGYLFAVEDTNYIVGDSYKITFFDNFTERDRTDDVIVKIKRVG